ncbi:MAG: hypothetical protein ACPLRM_10245 [Anaerolineae bacterium]
MKRTMHLVLAACIVAAIVVSGCGRAFTEEKKLVDLCRQYTLALAEKKIDQAAGLLTGEALEAMKFAAPIIEAAEVTTVIKNFEGKVGQMNKARDRAEVEASYIQEQTVEGYGTTVAEFSIVYYLKKVDKDWKIYSIRIVQKK